MRADGGARPGTSAALLVVAGLALSIGCAPAEPEATAVAEPAAKPALNQEAPRQEAGQDAATGDTGAQPPSDQSAPEEPSRAQQVARLLPGPDFELLGLDGELWRLSDLRGRVVLVNFWATWCTSCRAEMPELDELQSTLGALGVTVLGIATDRDPAKVGPYIEELGVHYPILLDPEAISTAIFGGVEGYPKTFILDRDGQLYSSYLGARPRAVFETDLRYLLDAPPSPPARIPD